VACGKTVCHECRRLDKSKNYCPDCVPGRKPFKKPKKKANFKSPTLAFMLSAMPGLGQIYCGSVFRGLFFLAGALVCFGNRDVVPLPVLIFLLLFCAWDARMAAIKKNNRLDEGTRGVTVGEGDWMLWGAAALLAFLFVWLPDGMGVVIPPWAIWTGFAAAFALSLMMGCGGHHVSAQKEKV